MLASGGPAAIAENDADMRYPHLERLRQLRERPAAQPRPSGVARPRPESARRLAAPSPDRPPVEATFFVATLGDSLGLMLADGLRESLATDRPHVGVLRKARDSSGLVREDFFDWRKAAHDIANGAERVDYAVIMLGSNDRQQMRDADGAVLDPLTPRWREVYGARIEAVVGAFRARAIPVIWVGLPIMRQERYAADIAQLNEMFRIHAEKAGARYVDVWERFADDAGHFDAFGPDVNGQNARLRTADGIHLTRAGAVKLAHFVQGDIARAAGAAPAVAAAPEPGRPAPALVDPCEIDATAIVRDTLRQEEEARAAAARFAGIAPPDLPGALFLPSKPAAGAVVPLTVPALSPGGALAAGRATAAGGDAAALMRRALTEGRPQEAKPGRADDFAWPRR
ncbi:MAG: DUF459 domain-containing protein [Methylobacteriaceae bacterium]|nr:DUF459 domain-containing protein [Methylobacteriaceae bacterium]